MRRPIIDPNPDSPLKFYGWRAARSGEVYASTAPTTHGRPNPNYEVLIGVLGKNGRKWIARSLSGETFEADSQSKAGKALERFAEDSQ